MSLGQGSKQAGQFFTPYHVSQLTAQIVTENAVNGKYQVHEPSCGSGGMIIAVADKLRQQGHTLCNPYIKGNYPPERVLHTPARKGMLP